MSELADKDYVDATIQARIDKIKAERIDAAKQYAEKIKIERIDAAKEVAARDVRVREYAERCREIEPFLAGPNTDLITRCDGNWYVANAGGTRILGGPYPRQDQAEDRLWWIQHFKSGNKKQTRQIARWLAAQP